MKGRALQSFATAVLLLLVGSIAEAVEPRLRVSLKQQSAVPGQAIELEMTLLVPTWMPEPPRFPSFEAPNLIVRLPEGASWATNERVNGESWPGITRTYRLHPMTVGRFRLEPQKLHVTYAHPETRAPVGVDLWTPALAFEGRAPKGAEGLDPFLAASELALEQEIEGDPAALSAGDAFTRTLRVRVEGTAPIFVPPLTGALASDFLAAYPKEPVVEEHLDGEAVGGERVERVTYVAEAGGRVEMPPVTLRWWNLRSMRIEESRVPGFAVVASGAPPSPRAEPESRPPWGWIALALVVAAGLAWALRGLLPRVDALRARRRAQWLASEVWAFGSLESALAARDLDAVLRGLDVWLARSDATGEERDGISRALVPLGAALYGSGVEPASKDWDAALGALRAARKSCRARRRGGRESLPPLNPRVLERS